MSDEPQIEIGEGGVCPLCDRAKLTGPVVGMSPKVPVPVIGKVKIHLQICSTCSRSTGHQLVNCADQIDRRGA